MRRKKRLWEEVIEDDPAASLLNLLDVWIAFAVALVLAIVGSASQPASRAAQNASLAQLEKLQAQGIKIDRYRPSAEKLTGQGQRLGTAYRLANGEVVYVPDGSR